MSSAKSHSTAYRLRKLWLYAIEKISYALGFRQTSWRLRQYRRGSVQYDTPADDLFEVMRNDKLRDEYFQTQWQNAYWFSWMKGQIGRDWDNIRSVVDVGCGNGWQLEHFKRAGMKTLGLSGNGRDVATVRRRGMKARWADMHRLPLRSGSCDLLFSSHTLEHGLAPYYALMEWRRVVKPGSWLMIIIPQIIEGNPEEDFPDGSGDTMTKTFYSYGSYGHMFTFTYWQARWLFESAELEHVASAMVDVKSFTKYELDEIESSPLRDPKHPREALFLLRKPQEDRNWKSLWKKFMSN